MHTHTYLYIICATMGGSLVLTGDLASRKGVVSQLNIHPMGCLIYWLELCQGCRA